MATLLEGVNNKIFQSESQKSIYLYLWVYMCVQVGNSVDGVVKHPSSCSGHENCDFLINLSLAATMIWIRVLSLGSKSFTKRPTQPPQKQDAKYNNFLWLGNLSHQLFRIKIIHSFKMGCLGLNKLTDLQNNLFNFKKMQFLKFEIRGRWNKVGVRAVCSRHST